MATAATMESKLPPALEITEEEPDDDFRPRAPVHNGRRPATPASADPDSGAAEAGTDAVPEEAAELPPAPVLPPPLTGDWRQLEGVPRPAGAGPRYLAWNQHGHVALFGDQKKVELKYASEDKPQRFVDRTGPTMAALSSTTVCLASGRDAAGGSRLSVRPAVRWERAVFSAALGSVDEAVEAVACGEGFAAAVTSDCVLRFFSSTALPLGVICLPGPGVALAARGPLLLVANRQNHSESEAEILEYRLYDVPARALRATGRLPLSPGARLRWIGLTSDLAPVLIDSEGSVRAMLGLGAGAWGGGSAGGGGGAEWIPVMSLTEEEARVGPLWAVHASRASLFFAEVGLEAAEPQPPPLDRDVATPTLPADLAADEALGLEPVNLDPPTPGFGHGAPLRELQWQLPVHRAPVAGVAVERAMLEQLLARHADEMVACGITPRDDVAGLSLAWMRQSLSAFGELVKAGEGERALDVARFYLAGAASSKPLNSAVAFAEKAGNHKLADRVTRLPRLVVPDPDASPLAKGAVGGVPRTLARRQLAPLFEPGELDADVPSSKEGDVSIAEASPALAQAQAPVLATLPAPAPVSSPTVSASIPTIDEAPTPAATAVAPPPAAPRVNPFARTRPRATGSAQEPHLLRDALGGGARRAAVGGAGEPPAKAAKTS